MSATATFLLPANISFNDKAAPVAIINSGCSGIKISSFSNCNLSENTRTKTGLKVSGPPSNATGLSISSPCASPPIVCFAIAWNAESARSSFAAPWFKSGWISVFAYTPQRPEMSYTCSPFAASALNSSTGTFSTDAISSINAPVPPAQLPFIRISETLLIWSVSLSLKKIIFASWPPSSIAVPTFSYFFWSAIAFAATSCANGTPTLSAIGFAPEPVRHTLTFCPGIFSSNFFNISSTLFNWSAWCLS